jgi:hypothetical protein
VNKQLLPMTSNSPVNSLEASPTCGHSRAASSTATNNLSILVLGDFFPAASMLWLLYACLGLSRANMALHALGPTECTAHTYMKTLNLYPDLCTPC